MKLLLFSDVHVNKKHCQNIVEMSDKADIVVGAGDFGSLRMGIKKAIKWLQSIEKPAILVPGNSESIDELNNACRNWKSSIVLHGKGITLQGSSFFGIGGGIPTTPFGPWSWDFSEMEAYKLLTGFPENGILISHSPPKGILDVSSSGKHLGSEAVLKTIQTKNPKLVVCGHIHESSNQIVQFKNTTVINAGPRGIYYDI